MGQGISLGASLGEDSQTTVGRRGDGNGNGYGDGNGNGNGW